MGTSPAPRGCPLAERSSNAWPRLAAVGSSGDADDFRNRRVTFRPSDSRAPPRRAPTKGRHVQHRSHPRLIAVGLLSSLAGLAACGIPTDSAGAASKPSTTLTVLVTNDDGVSAPGINATVQALSALPHTKVTVVAPLTNQSGYPATALAG